MPRFAFIVGAFLAPLMGAALACTAGLDGHSSRPRPSDPNANGAATGSGGAGATPGTLSATDGGVAMGVGGGAIVVPANCDAPVAPRAPLRRLTRAEYSNSAKDLVGDTTSPGNALPSEDSASGFGNDADRQSVSSLLAQQYIAVAEGIAARATAPSVLGSVLPCSANWGSAPNAAAEVDCVGTFAQSFAPRVFRRSLTPAELAELQGVFQTVRAGGIDFAGSFAAMLEGLLMSPDFLYRPEFGVPVPNQVNLMRPTGEEMATRLSYLYWGTTPDADLSAAALRGELDTKEGVLSHATRMLNDARSDTSLRYFFDNLLPISSLSAATRDPAVYPTFSPKIGGLMREETQSFLRYVIFQGGGSFDSFFTAPYTFANAELAAYYGYPAVAGDTFQRVDLPNVSQRLGLLTQGGILTGLVNSNHTNPVKRGKFVMTEVLCQHIPAPSPEIAASIKPPDPYQGATARERFGIHSQNPACAGCHSLMDPIGLAQENLDAVGLWRDTENGVVINAQGQVPLLGAPFNGPVELAQRVAATTEVKTCFSSHLMNYAYGRTLNAADKCTVEAVQNTFKQSNYDVKGLLAGLSQSDAFLYLSAVKE